MEKNLYIAGMGFKMYGMYGQNPIQFFCFLNYSYIFQPNFSDPKKKKKIPTKLTPYVKIRSMHYTWRESGGPKYDN